MKNNTIVLAYSGGLDTSYSLKKLSSQGYKIHAVSINTGGFSLKEILILFPLVLKELFRQLKLSIMQKKLMRNIFLMGLLVLEMIK